MKPKKPIHKQRPLKFGFTEYFGFTEHVFHKATNGQFVNLKTGETLNAIVRNGTWLNITLKPDALA